MTHLHQWAAANAGDVALLALLVAIGAFIGAVLTQENLNELARRIGK